MRTEYLGLGPVPSCEGCLQTGSDDSKHIRQEAKIFQRQLERQYPHARFRCKANAHDFGTYYDVEVAFNEESDEEATAAFEIESNTPENWDEVALLEVKQLYQSIGKTYNL